jgi:hypothetical protein
MLSVSAGLALDFSAALPFAPQAGQLRVRKLVTAFTLRP